MPELKDDITKEEQIIHLTKGLEAAYSQFFVHCIQSGIDPLSADLDTFEVPEDSDTHMYAIHFRTLVAGIKRTRASLALLQAE
jgi:hypothetical protein